MSKRFIFYISDKYVEFSLSIADQDVDPARKFLLKLLGIEGQGQGTDFYVVSSGKYQEFKMFMNTRNSNAPNK